MAKAPKKVIKRRRERKNVEKGAAHIRSSSMCFQTTNLRVETT